MKRRASFQLVNFQLVTVKLGSSPGSIDSEFKHPYLINSLLLPIFLDLLMALVILLCIFRHIPTKITVYTSFQECTITPQNIHSLSDN